jgi:histidine decarboxylase
MTLNATEIPAVAGPAATLNGRSPAIGQKDTSQVLAELAAHLDADADTNIGFPSTLDIDYTPLWPFFNRVLNNVGDPFVKSAYPRNTKDLEVEVLTWFATLLRAPQYWWGVTTSGGTEGIEYGFVHARSRYPDALVLFNQSAHYSCPKLARHLGLPSLAVRASRDGQLDLHDLRDIVRVHRHRPLIVLATIGTTMTEAIDDIGMIREVLDDQAVTRVWVHADAALSGLPLALLPPGGRPRFDLADGADSISLSAHKFCGLPQPGGIYLTRHGSGDGSTVDYIATVDSTLAGSRSGHTPLLIWYAIRTLGIDGLRARAQRSWQVAAYAVQQLHGIGWPAWRHPHAMTVVLDTPPADIATKWRLASSSGQSHIITVPGVTTAKIDMLIQDLSTAAPTHSTLPGLPIVPVPRSAAYADNGHVEGGTNAHH